MDKWQGLGYNSKEVASALYQVTGGDKRKLLSRATDAKDAIWGQAAKKLFPNKDISERDRVNLYMVWWDDRKDVWKEYDALTGKRTKPHTRAVLEQTDGRLCVCEKTTARLPRAPRIYCNKCDRNLHYACAEVPEETDQQDFTCGFCTGELLVAPMFDDTNTTDEKPFEKSTAFSCGNRRDFSDDDGDITSMQFTDDEMPTDSEDSCLGPVTKESRNESSSSSESSDLSLEEVEEPSPWFSPLSFNSSRRSSPQTDFEQRGFRRPSNVSKRLDTSPKLASASTEYSDPIGSDEEFEICTSDEDDWSVPGSGQSPICKRKRSPTTSITNNLQRSSGKNPFRSPIKKGPKVSFEDSTFADINDYKKGKHLLDSPNIVPDQETLHNIESVSAEDLYFDDDFEDFKPSKSTKHSTPRAFASPSVTPTRPGTKKVFESQDKSELPRCSTPTQKQDATDSKQSDLKPQAADNLEKDNSSSSDSDVDDTRKDQKGRRDQKGRKNPLDDPNFDKGEKLDASKVAREFTLKIPYDVWRTKILIQKPNTSGKSKKDYQLVKNYMAVIRSYFHRFNPFCNPTVCQSYINNPKPARSDYNFLRIRCECNRIPCVTIWHFTVSKKPPENKDVLMHVRFVGDITHYKNLEGYVRWLGDQQIEGQKIVANVYPYTAHARAYDNADPELLNAANYVQVPKLSSWQHMRVKKLAENDRDRDVYHDMGKSKWELREKFPDDNIPGYIQQQSSEPARFILFTKKQMAILQALILQNENVLLQVDATGGLVKSLPWPWDGETLLLYTVIMRCPSKNIHMPLTEMLTTDNTTECVERWLKDYFKCFQKECKIRSPHFGIRKFEMDFSKVLIVATIKVLVNCTLDEYILNLWHGLTGGPTIEARLFPIHVCRVHVVKAIRQKLKQTYPNRKGKETNEFKLMMLWTHRFVQGKSIRSFQRRLQDIGILCGFQYATEAVERRAKTMNEPTNINDVELWKTADLSAGANQPFWRRSPFGALAAIVFQLCEDKNAECVASNVNLNENPFYSPNLLNYIKLHISPYYPIISHCVFDCCNADVVDDTTNPIEQYHGVLKNNVHKYARNQKASRFVRKQADFINGLCKQFETKLGIQPVLVTAKTKTDNCDEPNGKSSSNKVEDTKIGTDRINQEPDWSVADQVVPNNRTGKGYKSPRKEKEIFKKPMKRVVSSVHDTFTSLIPLVRWGGEFVSATRRLTLINTCSMDTALQVLVGLHRHHTPFNEFLRDRAEADPIAAAVQKILNELVSNNPSGAKSIWINDVLRIDVPAKSKDGKVLDMVASEEENGFGRLQDWMMLARHVMCSNEECERFVNQENEEYKSSPFCEADFADIGDIIESEPEKVLRRLNETTRDSRRCPKCKTHLRKRYALLGNQGFFFYPLLHYTSTDFPESGLPLTQKIQNKMYTVFAYTVIRGDLGPTYGPGKRTGLPHFLTVFVYNNKRIVFDGLLNKAYMSSKLQYEWKVTSVWLVPQKN